jgi:hypothetical protein
LASWTEAAAGLDSGGLLRSLVISLALARIDPDGEHRTPKPAAHDVADLRRRDARQLAKLLLVESRVVHVERALGKRDSLAAEAADLLEPGDAARQRAHHGPADFVLRRPLFP